MIKCECFFERNDCNIMIRLPVKDLKEGMIIGQSIYNRLGASYLVKGQPITKKYIGQLEKIGIPTLNVTSMDPNLKLPPPEDVVQERTRITAIQRVYETYQSVEESGRIDVASMQAVSESILADILAKRGNLIQLTDIRLHDTYTFAHSVNVAVLSAMLGMLCRYTKKDMLLLTLGALLHDLGKINVPAEILNKNGRLTNDEFTTMKEHPGNGGKRIMAMQSELPSPAILSAIASQHHEHMSGRGYPNGLTGDKIHPFAKIAAIADVYDALTSERPYKKAYTPNVTRNIMVNVNKGQFDPDLLELFFNNVAVYPVGTILKTIWGYAIVKECEFGRTETPTIVLFANPERRVLQSPETIALADCPEGNTAIEIVVTDADLLHFVHDLGLDPSIYLTDETRVG